MDFIIKKYSNDYLDDIVRIWNEAIDEGNTLPWKEHLVKGKIEYIISTQTEYFCAVVDNKCVGFYMLHPNASGRCGHIANALYIVEKKYRKHGIGTALVKHSLDKAKEHNFSAMQYNSVVSSNDSVNIYLKLGFEKAGLIPNGFQICDDRYEDLLILYKKL